MKSTYLTFSLFHDDIEYRVEGTYTPEDPGRVYGPPENCYPPEPDSFEIDHGYYADSPDRLIPDDLVDTLTEKARERAAEIYHDQKAF
jgi:hypothetical protein